MVDLVVYFLGYKHYFFNIVILGIYCPTYGICVYLAFTPLKKLCLVIGWVLKFLGKKLKCMVSKRDAAKYVLPRI